MERSKCEQKGKISVSLRVSVKAKYFLIKQNPFTKYKFCKKNMEREMETGKGKIKMSRTEMQKLTLPKWHQNLLETSPENGTCWNTPCSAPQDFGAEEEAPPGLLQRARLSHLAWGSRAQRCCSRGTAGVSSAVTCSSYQRRWGGRKH